jgi:bromodomain-containing protein 7/9
VSRKDSYGVFYDPVPDDVPGYHEMIKRPMAFSDMKVKLDEGQYHTAALFQVRVALDLPPHTGFGDHSRAYTTGGNRRT